MRSLILATMLVATGLLPAEADTQKGLAVPLKGFWRGKELGGDHASDMTVAFEAEAGSLTYEHGTAAIGLRIRSLRVDGAEVRFSITAAGGVRHYVGTRLGDRISGRILSDGSPGRELGRFELVRRTGSERDGGEPGGTGPYAAPLEDRRPRGTPSGESKPAPASEVDELREAGRKRLQEAMAGLQVQAVNLGELVRYYDAHCRTPQWTNQAATTPQTSCVEALQAIGMLGIAVGHGLEQAEDDARRAWLAPGIVRQMREEYGLSHSFWDELSRAVRRLDEEARQRR
jgi:hypothetical protein